MTLESIDSSSVILSFTPLFLFLPTGMLFTKQEEKMSKSLSNTIRVSELLNHHSANSFRFLCLLSHYRQSQHDSCLYMSSSRKSKHYSKPSKNHISLSYYNSTTTVSMICLYTQNIQRGRLEKGQSWQNLREFEIPASSILWLQTNECPLKEKEV